MYSKEIIKDDDFLCHTVVFTIELGTSNYNTNDINGVCSFIKDSQEEIYSNYNYMFNGISIVGCDLIEQLRRTYE